MSSDSTTRRTERAQTTLRQACNVALSCWMVKFRFTPVSSTQTHLLPKAVSPKSTQIYSKTSTRSALTEHSQSTHRAFTNLSQRNQIRRLGRAPNPYYFLVEKVSPGDRSGLREASTPLRGVRTDPSRRTGDRRPATGAKSGGSDGLHVLITL